MVVYFVMLDEYEQIKKLLSEKRHILIVFRPDSEGDALGSALALKFFIEHRHRQVDIVASGFSVPKNLRFLTKDDDSGVKAELSNLQKFIIKVDVARAPIETLSYDVKDGWLSIYLTPKQGAITKNELRTAQSTYKYDLIIAIDTPDLDSLGEIFHNNTDLFYRVPIINIDNRVSNEQFGQVNLIDVNATAISEIVYELLTQLENDLIDEKIATALLTGLIAKTKSFKTASVTPHTLNLSSQLMDRGANREKIIQNLYRTKTVAALKLWGRVLTHLENDRNSGLVWATITRDDFSRSGAIVEDLREIVDELLLTSPEAKIVLLVYENPQNNDVCAMLYSEKEADAKNLLIAFNPKGDKRRAEITVEDKNLKQVEEELVNTIKSKTSVN